MPLIVAALLFFLAVPTAIAADVACRIVIRVLPDDVTDYVDMATAKVTLKDAQSNEDIPVSTSAGDREASIVIPPDRLYRLLDLEAVATRKEGSGTLIQNVSFFAAWPCTSPIHVYAAFAHSAGAKREVDKLWGRSDLVESFQTPLVGVHSASYTLAVVEARINSGISDKATDVVACFIALRAFGNLNKSSDAPLAMTERMRAVVDRYEGILQSNPSIVPVTISKNNASDKDNVANPRLAYSAFYRREWAFIKDAKDVALRGDGANRFLKSLNDEGEDRKRAIMDDIALSEQVVLTSVVDLNLQFLAAHPNSSQAISSAHEQLTAVVQAVSSAKSPVVAQALNSRVTALRRIPGI